MNDWFGLKCKCNMCSFLNVLTMLRSLNYDIGFDLFNYTTVLLYVVVFFCFIYLYYKVIANFDFDFYYPRINKNIIIIIIIIIIITEESLE